MQLKAMHYYIERKIENINLSVCTANSDLYSVWRETYKSLCEVPTSSYCNTKDTNYCIGLLFCSQ